MCSSDLIFYHDCDIIFTRPISEWITEDIINDNEWYGSDTRWYIAHSYIKGKGQEIIDKMCEIMQLPEELIEENVSISNLEASKALYRLIMVAAITQAATDPFSS